MRRILTLLTATALLLAGCGSSDDTARPPAEVMADYLNGEVRPDDEPITPEGAERVEPEDCADGDKNGLSIAMGDRLGLDTARTAVAALYLWCGEDAARAAVDESGVAVNVADVIDTVDRYAG